jgi:ribosomal protein L34E
MLALADDWWRGGEVSFSLLVCLSAGALAVRTALRLASGFPACAECPRPVHVIPLSRVRSEHLVGRLARAMQRDMPVV